MDHLLISKFVQLIPFHDGIAALDEEGNVWLFMGQTAGWAPLNRHRLSPEEAVDNARKLV